ncbi:hypothetical protein L208DRAFT_1396789 [Tricholoma matsutake]|nr:hypothetical protein L208DRAFT_1396789 [Tricholoma matsutake 945]
MDATYSERFNERKKGKLDSPMTYLLQTTHRAVDISSLAPVGILGAGAGGLYTASILEDLGIPYQIIEAQGYVGEGSSHIYSILGLQAPET